MWIEVRSKASARNLGQAVILAAVVALSSACAGGSETQTGSTCPATDPQCVEDQTVIIGPADPDESSDVFPVDRFREEARDLLGVAEADLPPEVRIGRRGDEGFMLTQDYVLGRSTVELDEASDGYRVVSVTVELPDGPETFTID
jgi:hypothetical protein